MRWLRRWLWTPYAITCRLVPLAPLTITNAEVSPGIVQLRPENWVTRLLGRIGGYPYAVMYVVDDEVLVDTGFGWARRALRRYLVDTGLADTLHSIVLTHEHEDHSANAAAIAQETGARVVAAPAAHAELAHPGDARLYRSFLFGPHDAVAAEPAPETIATATRTLRLVPTPGHTPGHLVAYDPATGTLIGGDLYLDAELDSQLTDADGPTWLASLRSVLELEVTLLADGHGTVLDGPDAHDALERKVAHLTAMRDAVETAVAAGPCTIEQITATLPSHGLVDSVSFGEGRMSLLTANDFSRSNVVRTFVADAMR